MKDDAKTESVERLVRRAMDNDEEARSTLLTAAEGKVRAFLRRVVLDEDLARDLTQDTIVEVVKSISQIRDPRRFWSWVYRIAGNKAMQHYRKASYRSAQSLDTVEPSRTSDRRMTEAWQTLSARELAQLTRDAMADLSERYRTVLALRFFEDMSHAEIAFAMDCSALNARTTFSRAKRAMLEALKKRGVHRSAFVAALTAFGSATLTTNSASAATVTFAGLAKTTWLGQVPAKAWLIAAVVPLIILTLFLYGSRSQGPTAPTPATTSFGVHFVRQDIIPQTDPNKEGDCPNNAFKHWIDFLEGPGGPFHLRLEQWDADLTLPLYMRIQNAEANYDVDYNTGTITIPNARYLNSRYRTRTLPTDSEEFSDYLDQIESSVMPFVLECKDVTHTRDPVTGYLFSTTDHRFSEIGDFHTQYEYRPIDPRLFELPSGMSLVDERDAMHRRGWTTFSIEGELAGRPVEGAGQIPFVSSQLQDHPPWMIIAHNGTPVAWDDGASAEFMTSDGQTRFPCKGGVLFRGMSRPWVGFHTLDTIRRDAVEGRHYVIADIPLNYRVNVFEDFTVKLMHEGDTGFYTIQYTIDLRADVLRQIEIWMGNDAAAGNSDGRLTFIYDQDEPAEDGRWQNLLAESRERSSSSPEHPRPASMLWLADLLNILADKPIDPPLASKEM